MKNEQKIIMIMCSAEVMKTCPVDNTFKLIGKKFYYSDNMQYVKQTVKIQ